MYGLQSESSLYHRYRNDAAIGPQYSRCFRDDLPVNLGNNPLSRPGPLSPFYLSIRHTRPNSPVPFRSHTL